MSKPNAILFRYVLVLVWSLLALCSLGYSQTAFSSQLGQDRLSYYHFNESLSLPVASQWLSVKVSSPAANPQSSSINSAQASALQEALAVFGARVTSVSLRGFHLVRLPGSANVQALAVELSKHREVAFVAPVLLAGHVRQLVTDEFIVRLGPPFLQENGLAQLAGARDAEIVRKLDEHTFLLQAHSGKDGLQAANEFHHLRGIAFAQPNFVYPAEDLRSSIPSDPYFHEQWALQNLGQSAAVGDVDSDGNWDYVKGVAGADVDAVRAWEITRGYAEIKIAVLDSGIDLDHPDLQANILTGYDAVARDSIANDDNFHSMGGHGTAVAGIIAAVADNGLGISGLAPNCKLMPIRVFDENSTDDVTLASGIRAAADLGADVLNNSWCGGSPSAVITDAIQYAHTKGRKGRGCAIVFSAGNAGTGQVPYPAALAQVIAAGAANMFDEKKSAGSRDGQLKWGSNYGAALDVVAPTLVYTTDLAGSEGYSKNDYYAIFDGTSAAAPHVAALAGLLLSLNPGMTAGEVQNLIEASCDKIGRYAYSVARSNGWWNTRFGYGRINAYRALKLALGEDVVPPQISHAPMANVAAHADVIISAQITDASGVAVNRSPGHGEPALVYRVNHGTWQFLFDEDGLENHRFDFLLPKPMRDTQIEYYLVAHDASANKNRVTFPLHSPNERDRETVSPAQCFAFFCGELKRASRHSTATPQIISAENPRVISALEVPASFHIADVDVQVDLRHSYVSDLILALESPRGTRVTLSSRNGEGGNDYQQTTFDDEAATTITEGKPPYLGAFQPDDALAQFDGEEAAGVWKLIVLDRVDWDEGSLEGWGLTFSHVDEKSSPTRMGETLDATPTQFELYDSYPNPFKLASAEGRTPGMRIAFALPNQADGEASLRIYNTLGQLVRTLVQRELVAGKHEAWWDGRDEAGQSVAAGIYLYALQAGPFVGKKKLMVTR